MKLYVNMVDRFMSGWGGAAGGVSRYSIECDTSEQARAIEKAAHARSEMKHISVCLAPPRKRRAGDHVRVIHVSEVGGPWLAYMPAGAVPAKEG
ncbi:MAG: hypothetical protein INH13_25765 [Cupriavidus sp.]|nr:hypothetical protein [Cupriavidus sp.]MCA3392431.1 hypothetical protein [Roseomonas sp.]